MANIITSVSEFFRYITALKSQGKTIGFAPTIGALYDSHLTILARTALSGCGDVIPAYTPSKNPALSRRDLDGADTVD